MAYHIEEAAWKCPKHPSTKRRTTTGVCSICLIDRLSQLCPHCANVRPCSSNCSAAIGGGEAEFSRSKSVGIPFLKSLNVNSGDRRNQQESEKNNKNIGGGEPAFPRSKSVGIPFLKSRNVNSGDRRNQLESDNSNQTTSSSSGSKITGGGEPAICRSKSVGIPFLNSQNVNSDHRRKSTESKKSNKTASFWRIFKSMKARKSNDKYYCRDTRIMAMTIMRSRSVNVEMTSVPGGNDVSCSPEKLKVGWYLVSPMKVFRQSPKAPKLVN